MIMRKGIVVMISSPSLLRQSFLPKTWGYWRCCRPIYRTCSRVEQKKFRWYIGQFQKCFHTKRTTADLNYNHLVATLQRDRDDLPLLSDLEIPPSDTQTISETTDEYHTHFIHMSSRVPGQDVVVMLKIFSSVSNNIPLAPTFWIGSLRDYQARKSAYFALILN